MFKLTIFVTLACLAANCFSADITEREILKWLTDKSTETKIVKIEPIRLENREIAYLASAEYPKQGNNFWCGYILARPSLKIAKKLEEYGGQFNDVKVFRDPIDSSPSLIIIGSAGTGQGHFDTTQYVVSIRDFNVVEHYSVYDESNIGDCGKEYDRGTCNTSETILNFSNDLSNGKDISLIQTSIKQKGDSPEHLKADISTKILKIQVIK